MYVKRDLSEHVLSLAKGFPIIGIFGPRQSGKTTLAKNLFPDYKYINLENLTTLEDIKLNTEQFLKDNSNGLIIDEAQKYPELFSYLQVVVDELKTVGKFILTGSENYLLSNRISQSLAGRIGIVTLLPFSLAENPQSLINERIIQGSYPRLFESIISPADYYDSYIATYIERDVRNIINLVKYDKFFRLLRVLANRCGNILNLDDISRDVGVERETIENWISVLKSTYIIFNVQPYYNNLGKRIIKSPKLCFCDTGILCRLLDINDEDTLLKNNNYGKIFENFVLSEILKHKFNCSPNMHFYYWRDSNGNEIDLILEKGSKFEAIEIKSSDKINKNSAESVFWFKKSVKEDAEIKIISRDMKSYDEIQNINIQKLHDYLKESYLR